MSISFLTDKARHFVKAHKFIVFIVSAILLVVISSAIIYSLQAKPSVQSSHNTPTTSDESKKVAREKTSATVSLEDPAANSSQDQTIAENKTSASSPSPKLAPSTAPSLKPTFAINSVSLSGAQYYCGSGTLILQVGGGSVHANSNVGGTFVWQLEVSGAVSAQPYQTSATIPSGGSYVSLETGLWGGPGMLYSDAYAKDGESVRIHVISPNDVASPWFTIPAGAVQSCQ